MEAVIEQLLQSEEPSVRYKVQVHVLRQDRDSESILQLQEEIRNSPRVKAFLSERRPDGTLPFGPYTKWIGAHWVLAKLADIGYPPGDTDLISLREQVLTWLFSDKHWNTIKTINGRTRRCASQEGNAVYALLTLGLADERVDELVNRLIQWQWPDGGWNCDTNPEAINSSFHESLIPLRALALHANLTGNKNSRHAAEQTAEIFLKRRLFRREKGGQIMHHEFTKLHYPPYWHYDILFGLKVVAEAGLIDDPRCSDALDLLESKRLPDGGWPAEKKYYRVTQKRGSGRTIINWGGTSKLRMNEWVTADALYVMRAANRLSL
jgi:hypothetical protein